MKNLSGLLALGLAVLASSVLASSASATSGTLVITSNTTLTEDHVGTIVLARNGITLDCAGYTLTGAGAGSGPGVYLPGTRAATVKNCRITNFDYGLLLEGANGNTFVGNNSLSNHVTGFDLNSSSGNTFVDNSADGNLVHGIAAVGGRLNTLKENSASGNVASGFSFIFSDDNTFIGNVATANDGGFGFQSSSGNVVKNNVASDNASHGFGLNPFEDSAQPVHNTLRGNVAERNGLVGFFLSDASFNRVASNLGQSNGEFDAAQHGSSIGNEWVENTFGTTFGI